MVYHGSACDRQFSLKHQCCRNPIGRDEIPETSRQASAAYSRNEEYRNAKSEMKSSYSETPAEAPSSFKP